MDEPYDHALFDEVPAADVPPLIVLAAWCLRRGAYAPSRSRLAYCGWCDAERRPAPRETAVGIGWTLKPTTPADVKRP